MVTPAEKIERISASLKASKVRRADKREAAIATLQRAREGKPRQRYERLQSEFDQWQRAIYLGRGSFVEIAKLMGCSPKTAELAVWDLGLWSYLIRARMDNPRFNIGRGMR